MRHPRPIACALVSLPLLGGACATLGVGSGHGPAPFVGASALTRRLEVLHSKGVVVKPCFTTMNAREFGGDFEVTADADGKVAARTISWKGPPEVEKCILEEAKKVQLDPLPGAAVAHIWQFYPPDTPPPPPIESAKLSEDRLGEFKARIAPEVEACAQRNLPPEFPADVEASTYLFAGGKPYATNITSSTANDGGFDACVREVIAGKTFPDPQYRGAYPIKLAFHVGSASH